MGRWARKKEKAKNKYTAKDEVYSRLRSMYERGRGTSKYEDKKNNLTGDKIYSSSTYETYKKQGKLFCTWARNNSSSADIKKLDELRPFVDDYLQELIDKGYSPWTLTTIKSALAKIYGVSTKDFIETPPRRREAVTRSRFIAQRDKNISSETEAFYGKITASTGLRRRELEKIKGSDLVFNNKGVPFIKVTKGTKGGRPRFAQVVGKDEAETAEIVSMFQKQGSLLLVGKVPSCFDNHSYRADYAKRVYLMYSRDISTLDFSDKYYMRGDRRGEVLDREAMLIASKCLGHSRIDVIASSYLHNLSLSSLAAK